MNQYVARPYDPFAAIRREFDRKVGHGVSRDFADLSVTQYADKVVVTVDVPGLTQEEIHVEAGDGVLTISGRRDAVVPEQAKQLFSNRQFGEFQRMLKLHDSIDPDSIDAVLEDGVLKLTMSLRTEQQPRRISVRSA